MKYWTRFSTEQSADGIPAGWPIERITANEWQKESPGPDFQLLDEEEIKAVEAPHKATVESVVKAQGEAMWAELSAKLNPPPKKEYIDPSKLKFYFDEHGKIQFEASDE